MHIIYLNQKIFHILILALVVEHNPIFKRISTAKIFAIHRYKVCQR